MEIVNDVLLQAARTVLALSVRALIVFAFILPLRLLFIRKKQHHFIRLLWLVLLFQLAIPLQIETAWSPYRLLPREEPAPSLIAAPRPPDFFPAPAVPGPSAIGEARPADLLALAWLAGALAAGTGIVLARRRLKNRLRRARPVTSPEVLRLAARLQSDLRLRTRITLVESDEAAAPFVSGLFRPALVLPTALLPLPGGLAGRLRPAELECVLAHELCHVKRKDLWLRTAFTLLAVVHWWNPLVWIALRLLRQDLEYACDADAVATLGEGRARPYGETVLRLLALFSGKPVSRSALGILDDKHHLQRRIAMIATLKRKKNYWCVLGVAAVLAVALVLGTKEARADDQLIAVSRKAMVLRAPVRGPSITQEFGWLTHPLSKKPYFHNGLDLKTTVGTPVAAAADGEVQAVNTNPDDDYGIYIVIRHRDGLATYYTKLDKALVRAGQTVKAGETVGRSGNTGVGTGPHLHFSVTLDGRAVNPREYILF